MLSPAGLVFTYGAILLQILAKTDIKLTRGDPQETAAIQDRVTGIKTAGEAEAYAKEERGNHQGRTGSRRTATSSVHRRSYHSVSFGLYALPYALGELHLAAPEELF
jgi:hypothetical protein